MQGDPVDRPALETGRADGLMTEILFILTAVGLLVVCLHLSWQLKKAKLQIEQLERELFEARKAALLEAQGADPIPHANEIMDYFDGL